jgi:hypothetical protein
VDSTQWSSEEHVGVQLLLKDIKRGWVRVDNRLQLSEDEKEANKARKLFSKALLQNVQNEIVDFEEHLEDLQKDWRNPNVIQLLELNAA